MVNHASITYFVKVERSVAAAGLGSVGRRIVDRKARHVEVGRRLDWAHRHAASSVGLLAVCSRPLYPRITSSTCVCM